MKTICGKERKDALDRQDWQTQQNGNLTSENREYAYKLAVSMLQNGLMPDSSTLTAAGISTENAQALANLYKTYMANTGTSGSSRSTGGSGGSSGSGKPKLTYSQALSAIENGQVTDAVKQAFDYYMGAGAYEQYYGGQSGTGQGGTGGQSGGTPDSGGQGMNSSWFNAFVQSAIAQYEAGKEASAIDNIKNHWNQLSEQQREGLRNVFANRFGVGIQ